MIKKWKIALAGLSIAALNFYCINVMRIFSIKANDLIIKPELQNKKLTLDTVGCQIPYLDPMHPSIAHLIKRLDPLICETKLPPPIIPGENPSHPSVKLLFYNLGSYDANTTCFYNRMYRLTEDKTGEDKEKHPIDKEYVKVTDEFIKVECVANETTVFTDYFAFIQTKSDVEKRCQNAKTELESLERLNVLLLGIDSMSKNQFLRHMKRTFEYITWNTYNVDFKGFNKIGQNTYPNMVSMLTGKLTSELPDTSKVYANNLPFIWNEFAKSGYRILYNEDTPSMFNYARKGFDAVPTDYYLRPFNLATESSFMFKKSTRGCFNNRVETDVILKYTGDFFDVFKDKSVFALTFLSRLSHDYINEPSLQDEPFMKFMKRMKQEGHLERSIVFFFGDHGFRFGSIRNTYVGRIEGKLPFLFILVPSWFPDKYPHFYANLKSNSHRLTTALDIYATLKDILHFTGQVSTSKQGRSVSLMNGLISVNRTCEDAHIANQFCACTKLEVVPSTSEPVVKAAQLLVDKINEFTESERTKCANFKLYSVKSATIEHVGLGETHTESTSPNYQVTFQVSPSGGIFEGSVWYLKDKKTYRAHEEIERVNRYGNQSICINNAVLKPFCYCYNGVSISNFK